MTCIAAIKFDSKVYMAADSACSIENAEIFSTKTPKIFSRQGILVGGAGSWRFGQVIETYWNPNKLINNFKINLDPVSSGIIDSMIDICDEYRVLQKLEDSEEIGIAGQLLLAYKDKLWFIGSDFSCIEITYDNYFAIGSGSQYAMGSLFSTNELVKDSVGFRLRMAILASCNYDVGVKEPIVIMST